MHTHSTNDALSKDTKIDDFVTLTVTFALKQRLGLYCNGGVFYKHILIIEYFQRYFTGLRFSPFFSQQFHMCMLFKVFSISVQISLPICSILQVYI